RSSTASWAPVEAPEGTAARPVAPSSRLTSTSTVGLPRLSRISRACRWEISIGLPYRGCFSLFVGRALGLRIRNPGFEQGGSGGVVAGGPLRGNNLSGVVAGAAGAGQRLDA